MQQAKILLEKITTLQKSISLNQGTIAPIERDLMLSYIRQLYEVFLNEETTVVKSKSISIENDVKVAPKPQEIEPPKPVYTPPRVVETPKPPVVKQEPVVVREVPPLPPVTPNYQPTYTQPTTRYNPPVQTPVSPPAVQRKAPVDSSKLNTLFDFRKSNDLSERLSERPITDLTKAFAINDRLLYINELFGKDANSFGESLKLLNKFERMEEAKSLMVSLAEQYNWTEGERMEIAQGFVRTVRRKYA